jgi:hypothetical protein
MPAIDILIYLKNFNNFFGEKKFEKNVISTPEGHKMANSYTQNTFHNVTGTTNILQNATKFMNLILVTGGCGV